MKKATTKIKLRSSSVAGQPGSIVYQITRGRAVKLITTPYKLLPEEWSSEGNVIVPFGDRKEHCQNIKKRIQWDLQLLHRIIDNLDQRKSDYTSGDVALEFHNLGHGNTMFGFVNSVISRQRQLGLIGTATNYKATFNSFSRWRKGHDLQLEELTPSLIEEYEAWLKSNDLCPNTTSFYMRNLRAIYQRAVEEGLVADKRPFTKVYSGVDKTRKRAITAQDLRRIKQLDLSQQPSLEFARDLFLFQFYCMGISFVDVAYLRKTAIKGDTLSYRRQKTRQSITVPLSQPILNLISRYNNPDTPYLLPIITTPGTDERKQYQTALHRINSQLKRIAKLSGIEANISTYTSRHSWASIAQEQGVPIHTISDALGHDSVTTTEIYLSSIDVSHLRLANSKVLSQL